MESNVRLCKVCRQLKTRTEVGKYNIKDKKYVDENYKAWNGSTCPSCALEKVRNLMRLKRIKNVETT